MANRPKTRRGPKPKFRDVACPNRRCRLVGKKGRGNVVSNGTYRTRSISKRCF